MEVSEILNPDNLRSDIIAYVIVALAVVLVLFINRRSLLMRLREWNLQRSLNHIGSEQIRDLVCPGVEIALMS